jgi:hypothetical protein
MLKRIEPNWKDCTREDRKPNGRKSQVGKLRRKYKTKPEVEKEF